MEKRLLRIVRARGATELFALRRSSSVGPAIIDCVFREATLADELAEQIAAVPVKPPLGWATCRELVADDHARLHLMKLGVDTPLSRTEAADDRAKHEIRDTGPIVRPSDAGCSKVVGEALKRLSRMSAEEQGAALFEVLRGGKP